MKPPRRRRRDSRMGRTMRLPRASPSLRINFPPSRAQAPSRAPSSPPCSAGFQRSSGCSSAVSSSARYRISVRSTHRCATKGVRWACSSNSISARRGVASSCCFVGSLHFSSSLPSPTSSRIRSTASPRTVASPYRMRRRPRSRCSTSSWRWASDSSSAA